jgi:hypothetical protein
MSESMFTGLKKLELSWKNTLEKEFGKIPLFHLSRHSSILGL